MLTAPHITLLRCNNKLATFLPSVTDKVPHDCLKPTDHLLTPHDDLQESPVSNADFSCFTDGSYSKGDNGKSCAGYAFANPFDVVEAASLPMTTSAQQAELYTLTGTCTLAKDKIAVNYTDSKYVF